MIDVWELLHEHWRGSDTCSHSIHIDFTLSGWMAAGGSMLACANMLLLYVLYISYRDPPLVNEEVYVVSECISPISPSSRLVLHKC